MEYNYTRSFAIPLNPLVIYRNGVQVYPMGAWPENAEFPIGWAERDSSGI